MREIHRDQPKHSAYPIDDPHDKTTFRGMSVKCWLAGQVAKGIASGFDYSSATQEDTRIIGRMAVNVANDILGAFFEDDQKAEAQTEPVVIEAPPKVTNFPPAKEAPHPYVPEDDESPGAEDTE